MLTPKQLLNHLPLTSKDKKFIEKSREKIKKNFFKKNKIIIIVGPCSIHCKESILEYAKNLKILLSKLNKNIFIIMRCFFEKPRSSIGWKGYVYNPYFKKKDDIEKGIIETRKLLLKITSLKIPIASEILDPLFINYFKDLITYAVIGSRTSTSQIHRQLASCLTFPVGIKNPLSGDVKTSIKNILSAQSSQSYMNINEEGKISSFYSDGNIFSHLILRGSIEGENYKENSIKPFLKEIKKKNINCPIIIDCAHDNSKKIISSQKKCFSYVIKNIKEMDGVIGIMLESFLKEGAQKENKIFGKSITDPCLSFEETKKLLLFANDYLKIK